jgi:hypothetical protein
MKQIIATTIIGLATAESMYNPLKSEVAIYNPVNFPKQVTNNREKGISIVQFYEFGGKSQLIIEFRRKIKEGLRAIREVCY